MNRAVVSLVTTLVLCLPSLAQEATESNDSGDQPAVQSIEQQLRGNPNDAKRLNEFFATRFQEIGRNLSSNPDKAEQQMAELREFVEAIKPDDEDAKRFVGRARSAIAFYETRIKLARVSLDELKQRLTENPDDQEAITLIASKISQQLAPIVRSEPERSEKELNEFKELLETTQSKATSEDAKRAIDRALRSFSTLERRIETGKKLLALIGTEACPLEVEAWVNGSPLVDSDLKGKVVLLDFWAVWCGPCIATFPHLREWHESYSDKGLVIVGLTRYYNYQWDDDAGRATRSDDDVTPEDEQKMLVKFAEHHELHHRFAIQKDNSLSEYYAVTGIPHVVLIDRSGTIRLIRVGSGEQNARDIEKMLVKLIADPADEVEAKAHVDRVQ